MEFEQKLNKSEVNMPKKKTGARKKAEKQKERQKEIKSSSEAKSLVQHPCNKQMVQQRECVTINNILLLLLFL